MFAGLPLILVLILAGQSVSQGIDIRSLPANDGYFEVVAGYRAGVRNETGGQSGLAATVASFLSSTASGRELTLAAYGSGGDIRFFSELDRTGFRLKVPDWARPMVEPSLAAFFRESPSQDRAALAAAMMQVRERASASEADFRARVEDEVRIALLGAVPYHHPPAGWSADLARISEDDLIEFFTRNYGTDRAFVLSSGPALATFGQLPSRLSVEEKPVEKTLLKAQRLLRFEEQASGGAVIFASPVTTVFYRGWYAVLMLDRLIQAAVPAASSSLTPTLDPYYYRIEVAVPSGQFADQVEQSLMQELERLQYARASDQKLNEARDRALEYLESPEVRSWFQSFNISDRLQEGIEWVRTFSADDMRIAVRELLLSNRVLAGWSPKPRQVTVQAESLEPAVLADGPLTIRPERPALAPIRNMEFSSHPQHADRIAPQGPGAAVDLPAVLVLRALIYRRIIEAGLWGGPRLEVRPAERQGLVVIGDEPARLQVLAWVQEISDRPPSEGVMIWAREAAIHRLDSEQQGFAGVTSSTLQQVTAEQLQDVARIYLANR